MATLLLVDHTAELQAPLEAAGHTVTLATDGRMALERLKDHSFELIVTELFLPEVDGFELLRWTENQPPPVPKVIAMTAGIPAMPVMPALLLAKAQAAATLPRPFEPAQLLAAIAAIVSPVAELIEPPAIRAR